LSAFESRTILKPSPPSPTRSIDESDFLERIDAEDYRAALERIFHACRGLGLRLNWGAVGTSIRVITPHSGPVTVGWVFPPTSGLKGLRDFNMGFESQVAAKNPDIGPILDGYVERVSALPGANRTTQASLTAYHLQPSDVVSGLQQIVDELAQIVGRVGEMQT
jgi:hypothetical protein